MLLQLAEALKNEHNWASRNALFAKILHPWKNNGKSFQNHIQIMLYVWSLLRVIYTFLHSIWPQ